MEKITYAIIILAVIILLLYVGISINSIREIKETLKGKESGCAKTDNGCDVCCRDCQDSAVCIGCCVHVKEEGEKENGNDKL